MLTWWPLRNFIMLGQSTWYLTRGHRLIIRIVNLRQLILRAARVVLQQPKHLLYFIACIVWLSWLVFQQLDFTYTCSVWHSFSTFFFDDDVFFVYQVHVYSLEESSVDIRRFTLIPFLLIFDVCIFDLLSIFQDVIICFFLDLWCTIRNEVLNVYELVLLIC